MSLIHMWTTSVHTYKVEYDVAAARCLKFFCITNIQQRLGVHNVSKNAGVICHKSDIKFYTDEPQILGTTIKKIWMPRKPGN
jgi:hypothetical protein